MIDATHFIELHLTNDQELYEDSRYVARTAIETANDYPMLDAADALADYVLDSMSDTLDWLDPASWQVVLIRDLLPGKGDVDWRQIVESLFGDDELTEMLDGKPAF